MKSIITDIGDMTITPTDQRAQYVTVPLEPLSESSELASIILEQDVINARSLFGRVCIQDSLRITLCITTIGLLFLGFVLAISGGVVKNAALMWTGAGVMTSSIPVYAGFTYVNNPGKH